MKKFLGVVFGFIFSLFLVVGTVGIFAKADTPVFSAEAATEEITIRFYDEKVSSLKEPPMLCEKTYSPGEEIKYPDQAPKPTKESKSSKYIYEFSGWTRRGSDQIVNLAEINESVDLYAKYTQKYVSFTVSFYKSANILLTNQEFRFDDTNRTYNGPTPTQSSTASYSYNFVGWKKSTGEKINLNDITEDDLDANMRINLFAEFEEVAVEYKIKYNLGNGTAEELKETYTCEDAEFILPQPTPNEPGVTFVGWSGTDIPENEFRKEVKINPKAPGELKEREYTAVYSTNEFTVTFVIEDDGKNPGTLSENQITVTYGAEIQIDNAASKITIGGQEVTAIPSEANVAYTFTFGSFETEFSQVTQNITITVKFNATPKNYSIEYNNDGGSVVYKGSEIYNIESGQVRLGEVQKTGFTFNGWIETDDGWQASSEIPIKRFTVSSEADLRNRYFKAQFTENVYSVTFTVLNGEYGTISSGEERGTTITLTGIKEGSVVSRRGNVFIVGEFQVTATPNVENLGFIYSFNTWNYGGYGNVYDDFEVEVVFTATEKEYRLSYSSGMVEVFNAEGGTLPSNAQVRFNDQITVQFNLPDHHHIVSFQVNGNDVSPLIVEGSNQITITLDETYIDGNGQIINIEFFETIDTFTVQIVANDDEMGNVSVPEILNVPYGTEISVQIDGSLMVGETQIIATPNPETEYLTYSFRGWDTEGKTIVDGDITITANFDVEYSEYTITFDETHVVVLRRQDTEFIKVANGEQISWGTELVLTFTATEHHHCKKFTINEIDYLESITENGQVEFTITSETVIEAEEEINRYKITFGDGIEVKNAGTEVVSGEKIEALTELEVTYTLAKNYQIKILTIAGEDYRDSENPITFTIVRDTEIVFESEKAKIPITCAEAQNGTFSLSANSMECDGEVTITVTPAQYFKFKRAYYVIKGQVEETDIEGLSFTMPDDEITVYVEFEREFYHVEDSEKGVGITIKVSDISGEPRIAFEEVSLEFENMAKSRINAKAMKIYSFKVYVDETEIVGVGITVTIKIPTEFTGTKLELFKTISGEGNITIFESQQYQRSGDEISFETTEVLPYVFVEREESSSSTLSPETNNNVKNGQNKMLIIAISCAASVIVVIVIILIVVAKKRKKHKK